MKIQRKMFISSLLFVHLVGTLVFVGGVRSLLYAQTAIPHTFVPGTPIRANEVNNNFNAVATSIDSVHLHIEMNGADTAFGVGAHVIGSGEQNTAFGAYALSDNLGGVGNTAVGHRALSSTADTISNTAVGDYTLTNNTGDGNTAVGRYALSGNTTGSYNTVIGVSADVASEALTNATAIGANAIVNASNKIRLGNSAVTLVETSGNIMANGILTLSDRNLKENFHPIDGEEVLTKISAIPVTSWNFIGHNPKGARRIGPMAQDFYAVFGHDGVGVLGTETTINYGDITGVLLIAVQSLKQRTEVLQQKTEEISLLKAELARMQANHAAEIVRLTADIVQIKQSQVLERSGL